MNRLIKFAVDRPFWTIVIVAAISIGISFAIPHLTQETDFRKFLSEDDPIIKLLDEAEAKYGRSFGILVMVRNENGVFNEETLDKIKKIGDEISDIPGVESVTTPLNSQVITGTESSLTVRMAAPGGKAPKTPEDLATFENRVEGNRMLEGNVISSDGKAASISVDLEVDADEYAITPRIAEIVDQYRGGGDEFYLYGDAYFDSLMREEMETDLNVLFPLALFLMVVVLFVSFMNLRGVLIPITVVILSVIIAMGVMALAGFPMTMISFVAPVLLLAIGIADGIHVLNRYNEEIAAGTEKRQAIIRTMTEMKGPVIMTSLTTAAGFLSLLSSFFIPQKQFGIITAIGVLAAMVLSLLLIPAFLSILRPPKVRKRGKLRPLTRVLLGFERAVIGHRRTVLCAALLIVAVMAAGLPGLRVETSNEEFLGKDHPAIKIMKFVDEHFSGGMQVTIEIDTGVRDGLKDPAVLDRMVALEEFLAENGVKKTISLTDIVKEMNQKFHADDPAYYKIPDDRGLVSQLLLLFSFQGGKLGDMALGDFSAGTILGMYPMGSSADVARLADSVQTYLDEQFQGDVKARMIGPTILMKRMFSQMIRSQMIGIGTTVVAVGILVSLLMGSVVAGLIALIPLVLTVAVSLGIMAYTGTPLDLMTLMVSAIAVGIGVDYSIHFISRFRREYRVDQDGDRALKATIRSVGRGISYNALTVALGFFILIFASFKGTRSFGLEIALTMVVSAISAVSIIPAILLEFRPKFLVRIPWKKGGGETPPLP